MTERTQRRILLVDDEEYVLSALRRALRKERYELYFASGPLEALEVLAHQPMDLVLSDHLMPEMTGLEFLKIVRDRMPDCVRIMLTGHADMQTVIEAINQGEIYRFLTKPWDHTELKVTLHLAFEHLDLQRENRQLLARLRHQEQMIRSLELDYPGIGEVQRDPSGAILIDESFKATSPQM